MKQNKRIYEAPAMQVVELKSRQTLLTGSQLDSYSGKKADDTLWDE